jgi:hypothetical protein
MGPAQSPPVRNVKLFARSADNVAAHTTVSAEMREDGSLIIGASYAHRMRDGR